MIKNCINVLRSLWWLWFLAFVIICISLLFLYYLGFRPVHGPELEASWSAISALGQWASVLIGIIIPIILIYIQYQLDKNKEVIGEANRDLYAEFELFKLNIEDKLGVFTDLEDENGNIVIDANKALEVSTEELKSKILKLLISQ
ncbi:hypothetical protein [Turicibacter sanguinis]|uniref:hypothetical protein n=1 Tax=Turicibacter sanguinis TaxID=154288 RepID=UPI0006C52082|nr:hypothetical protein [Turicibacter sanguinis]MDB8576368.1 hypothetical protein [Turicibacter sanguinis]MDB8585059.1 hypothetical protein [Turicibacter sanguinis]MDB8588231.1 hypothetical protein [Turicibacter sanguinis]MDB8598804.1 hypothetical protein [Turicibacter sanguinis]CUN16766.1 Uncharacterised protein [Turicibacter sanguinis]